MSRLRSISRRSFVALLPGSALAAAAEQTASSEARRYTDPVTEFQVSRLTSPRHSSWLPAYNQSAVMRRGNGLLYVSDRSGSPQAWRMDTHNGESRRLTEAAALDRTSVTLTADQHSFCFMDGRSANMHPLNGGRGHTFYRVPDTHEPAGGFCVSRDGTFCTVAEKDGAGYRFRLIQLPGNTARTLFETEESVSGVAVRPGRPELLYRSGDALWMAPLDGRPPKRLKTTAQEIGDAYWSREGRTMIYLSLAEPQPGAIRELDPDTGQDTLVARTSRFVAFSPNSDDRVFVGASGSKVSPYVLILLRSVGRELTLCEHRSSDPAAADPLFSPDTQQIFFVSDREGKPAIYAMRVDRLLEKTDD